MRQPNSRPVVAGQADPVLAEHVAEIRRLGKRVVGDVVEIGRRLTECKEIVGHGRWLGWLNAEFGWSDRTALNFMRVYAMATKSENFSDLNLPVSALYLLAAPSTPGTAQTAIFDRAKAGDVIKIADVKKAIETETKRGLEPEEISESDIERREGASIDYRARYRRPDGRVDRRLERFADALAVFEDGAVALVIPPTMTPTVAAEGVARIDATVIALRALRRELQLHRDLKEAAA